MAQVTDYQARTFMKNLVGLPAGRSTSRVQSIVIIVQQVAVDGWHNGIRRSRVVARK